MKRRRFLAFTLLETALATVVVGVGTTAMLTLIAHTTTSNNDSTELTTAMNLADNIHELTERLTFSGSAAQFGMPTGKTVQTCTYVENLSGQTFNGSNNTGPIDATGNVISAMSNWSQTISVNSVLATNLTTTQPSGTTTMETVSVTVAHNGRQVFNTSWIVAQ